MIGFNGTWSGQGGFHNFIRLMEDWWNVPFEYSGSSVSLWDARLSQSRFTGVSYSPPIRQWAFERMYRSMNNLMRYKVESIAILFNAARTIPKPTTAISTPVTTASSGGSPISGEWA